MSRVIIDIIEREFSVMPNKDINATTDGEAFTNLFPIFIKDRNAFADIATHLRIPTGIGNMLFVFKDFCIL